MFQNIYIIQHIFTSIKYLLERKQEEHQCSVVIWRTGVIWRRRRKQCKRRWVPAFIMDKFETKKIVSQLDDSREAHPAILIGESSLLQLQTLHGLCPWHLALRPSPEAYVLGTRQSNWRFPLLWHVATSNGELRLACAYRHC